MSTNKEIFVYALIEGSKSAAGFLIYIAVFVGIAAIAGFPGYQFLLGATVLVVAVFLIEFFVALGAGFKARRVLKEKVRKDEKLEPT